MKRPALLVGSLRHSVDGEAAVGVVDLNVLRAAPTSDGGRGKRGKAHGTTTRGARRSDIR
jgi:hypothetical protein